MRKTSGRDRTSAMLAREISVWKSIRRPLHSTSIGVAENNDNREAPSRAASLFLRAGVFAGERYDAPREKEHDPREGHNQLTSSYGVLGLANCDYSLCRGVFLSLSLALPFFPGNVSTTPVYEGSPLARNAAGAISCGEIF